MITKEKMLTITASAINKVRDLLVEEKLPSNSALRMFVQGGGCSGYQYGFAFDEEIAEDDFVTENEGVKVVVDMISSQYLQGATLDYKEEKFNSQFVISNPNAKSTCGCGSSFNA
jgi:iron-sulfur cluster insertion protein